jgi:hypothetical protein
MKKLLPFLLLFILAMLIWDATFDPYHMAFQVDDADFDGPIGSLFGALLASGGIVIAIIVMVVAAIVLAVVCAGAGVVACVAVVLAALMAVLALSPLLVPLLVPLAIIWYLSNRDKQRRLHGKQQAA